MMAQLNPADETLWRGQLARMGYATCTNPACRLCFLSLAGMVAHHRNCPGWIREGDFVSCIHCDMRFKQFRSCQTHVEKLHRHLFNMEERDSDAELEAEEQRVPPIGGRAHPLLPPDVVPRQDGSIPAQSPPAHPQPPHNGAGKLVMVASPRLPGIPRPVAPALLTSPHTPQFSLRSSAHLGASLRPRASSLGLRAASSSNLDEIERKLRARERELEAAEARVRETEEHARRLRELQEKEALLKEREKMLARREEEAKKQVAAAAGASTNQSFLTSMFPRRPIVLPSSFRLPDTARRIHLPIVQTRQGEEIPMDLSSASVDLTVSQASGQSVPAKIVRQSLVTPGVLVQARQESREPNTKEQVKEEAKSCSPILERVIPIHQENPVVQSRNPMSEENQLVTDQTMLSSTPPLVDMSNSDMTEMVGVSALASPDSPAATTSVYSEMTQKELSASPSKCLKSKREEEQRTDLSHKTLQDNPVTETLHSESQEVMEAGMTTSSVQKESGANVSVPYTSGLAEEPHLTEGAVLGLDELLKNGEMLTLLATEEEDGTLTLVSPPISNKEDGDDSVGKATPNSEQLRKSVEVQELEDELEVLKTEVKDIMKGGEDPSSAASMAMVELCRESSLDTLEKRIESPSHGADLVEDLSKRLDQLVRDEGPESNHDTEDKQAELPDVMDELYSSPPEVTLATGQEIILESGQGEVTLEPGNGAEEGFNGKSELMPGELHSHVTDQVGEKVVKKKVELIKLKYAAPKRKISPKRSSSTPQHRKKGRMNDDDIVESASQQERRSNRIKSRDSEDSVPNRRKTKAPPDKMKKKAEKEEESRISAGFSSQKQSRRVGIQCRKKQVVGQTRPKVHKSPKKSIPVNQSMKEKSDEGSDATEKEIQGDASKAAAMPSLPMPTSKCPKPSMPTSQTIKCGSCPVTSQSEASWKLHCARKHAGLARPKGELQTFTEEEEEQACLLAFQSCKKIQCPRCKQPSFSRSEMLLQHYRQCGKVEIAIDVVKHEEEEEVTNPGGRSRRAAATKAKQKVAEFVEAITGKSNLDGESDADTEDKDVELSDVDDSDDNYDIEKEIGGATLYKFTIANGKRTWRCIICNLDFPNKAAVEGHVFTQHQAEVDDQDTESEVDESEEEDESDYTEMDSDDSYARPKAKHARKRRRSGDRGAVNLRRPILEPCPQVMHDEAAFRAEAYGSDVLPNLTWDSSRWNLEEMNNNFLPDEATSPKFTVAQGGQEVEGRLGKSEGALIGGSQMLYAGGPVWGLAWAPVPAGEEQVLAVVSSLNHECSTVGGAGEANGLVQFWKCGKQPQLQLGLGHTYGRIWEVAWCPSGGWTGNRLGLLAAACGDGTVRVWAVPKGEDGRVYSGQANLTLHCGDESGHCLGLSWHRGPGHRQIAACFSSGIVAIWDLATSSSLLRTSPNSLLPYHTWAAHQGSVTGISLSPSTDSVPRHLVTGGTDRHYRFWDLRDTTVPVQEVKRGLVTGVSWLPGWAAATVCYDDVYLQAHTQTLVAESGYTGTRSQPVVAQNSGVWGLATSQWLGAMAVGTAAGELIVFVLPASDRSMEHDKNVCQRRSYIYRTQLQMEGKADEEESRDFTSVRENAILRYIDLPTKKPGGGDCPLDETKKVRSAERMDTEDLSHYPLAMINRVAWNQNLGHHLKLASGGQAGLVRLHTLAALNTEEVRTAAAGVAGVDTKDSC